MADNKRESADDKLKRLVREAMEGERARADEEKDPNKAWLRKTVREEVAGALDELLGEGRSSGGQRRRRPAGDEGGEGEGGDSIIKSLFG